MTQILPCPFTDLRYQYNGSDPHETFWSLGKNMFSCRSKVLATPKRMSNNPMDISIVF